MSSLLGNFTGGTRVVPQRFCGKAAEEKAVIAHNHWASWRKRPQEQHDVELALQQGHLRQSTDASTTHATRELLLGKFAFVLMCVNKAWTQTLAGTLPKG